MRCPNCGEEVRYYHNSIEADYAPGETHLICSKHCQGMKIIKIIPRHKTKRAKKQSQEVKNENRRFKYYRSSKGFKEWQV